MWKWLAIRILKVCGWKARGGIPDIPKAVIIAAPHTSNWDGIWALTYKVAVGLDIRFFAKQSLFWFPLGVLLRGLGGIPLDRTRATSAVDQAIAMFNEEETFYFGLSPEGTRSLKDHWKTGFYRIARGADVPVLLGVLDFRNREIGIAGVQPLVKRMLRKEDVPVIIQADTKAETGMLVRVIDECKLGGAVKVSLATKANGAR